MKSAWAIIFLVRLLFLSLQQESASASSSASYLSRFEYSDSSCSNVIHVVVQAYDGTTCISEGTTYYIASIAPSSNGAASSYVANAAFYSNAACTTATQSSTAISATAVADPVQTSFTFVAGQCITGGVAGTNVGSTMYFLSTTFPQLPSTLSGSLTNFYSSSSCTTPRHADFTSPGYCRCDGGHCWGQQQCDFRMYGATDTTCTGPVLDGASSSNLPMTSQCSSTKFNGQISDFAYSTISCVVASAALPVSYYSAVRFDFTGDAQTFTVPSSALYALVSACGGGNCALGGYVSSIVPVTPGSTLYVMIGGGNGSTFNGGGTGNSSIQNGCGASDIRTRVGNFSSRLVTAGGAGGHGCTKGTYGWVAGGMGGGSTGQIGAHNAYNAACC